MKKFKSLVIGIFVLSMFSISVNAATANFNYGIVDLDVNPKGGAFTDTYTFELLGLSSIDYSVTKIIENYTVSPGNVISIFNFQGGAPGFNYGLFDSLNNKIFDSSSLTAGTYTLKVSGITTGLFGGSYNLYANVALLPVPEPDTSMMVLMGFAMIGLVSLRKAKSA